MKNDYSNGVWRTVGGKRIFITKGTDLKTTMKKSGKYPTAKSDKKSGGVIRVKGIGLKNEKEAEKYLGSKDFQKTIKDFIKNKQNNELTCCKEVSNEVTNFIKSNGIKAKTVNVTAYANGKVTQTRGHYVTEMGGKLYDFTGKQYLGEKTSNGAELRIYKHIGNNYFAQKDIKINNNISEKEMKKTVEQYTKNNSDKIILVKDSNYIQQNNWSKVLNK